MSLRLFVIPDSLVFGAAGTDTSIGYISGMPICNGFGKVDEINNPNGLKTDNGEIKEKRREYERENKRTYKEKGEEDGNLPCGISNRRCRSKCEV